jgi:hypothetical protein
MEQPYFIRGLGRRTLLPALCNEARSLCDVVQFQRGGMDFVSRGLVEMGGLGVRCI